MKPMNALFKRVALVARHGKPEILKAIDGACGLSACP